MALEDITKALGTNILHGVSETWLKETDDLKLWKNKVFKMMILITDHQNEAYFQCISSKIIDFLHLKNQYLLVMEDRYARKNFTFVNHVHPSGNTSVR